MSGIVWIIYIAVIVLIVAGFWKVFTKAGEAGWQSIIPIWNIIVLLRIVGRPWWWLILYIIPLVGFVISAIVAQDVAKSFARGVGFGIGLWLLSPIFYPILGFGDSAYKGPAAAS
jgi:hypothetical protein